MVPKTSVLTLQRLVNNSQFLLNILQYDMQIMDGESADDPICTQFCHIPPLPFFLMSKQTFESEIEMVQAFHEKYTLSEKNRPSWFTLHFDEITSPIDTLVANNCLNFDRSENIDCMLIRIMYLHWKKFYTFRYTIRYSDFHRNIEKFQDCLNNGYFVITRYMHMFSIRDNSDAVLTMLIIAPIEDRKRFWNELIQMTTLRIYEIDCIDYFIDTCLDLSCNNINYLKFPETEEFNILSIDYKRDVLSPSSSSSSSSSSQRDIIKLSSSSLADKYKNGFNYFFSPLSYNAKVYFYSQTAVGCVRAFDRLFHKNNLVNFITDVVSEDGLQYIYYSSMSSHQMDDGFMIRFPENEEFAKETYYRQNNVDIKDKIHKVFIINPENIKLVVDADQNSPNDTEYTIFPHCLFATNIKYRLTVMQATIYKVVQYHRERILLEHSNIPALFN